MKTLDSTTSLHIKTWLEGAYDDKSKKEIEDLLQANRIDELTDAFYKKLEFGTGGIRGIMGTGTNRINQYTIGLTTQGLANYLHKKFPHQKISVAIGYDTRNNSRFLAETTANVFSANNIYVFLFKDIRPTPELSFAIRKLGCNAGVVITASHNPKEYNGYKAYWSDGAQLTHPHDKNVLEEINKIQSIEKVNFTPNPEAIEIIGNDIDEAYLAEIKKITLSPEAIKKHKDLKIVYSPLHGTGITLVPRALEKIGFTTITIVEEQRTPNGNFPTVIYPNPEEKEAMSLSLQKAKEIDADLVLATDPDADRVGIAVKDLEGNFILLNGNQTGTLLFYYLIQRWKQLNKLTGNEYIVKTIVTTDLIDKIAQAYGVKCYNTLTGFKYIAEIIHQLEKKESFIAGAEESYGYMIGDFVRDKDAITSCAIICEMAAYAREQGLSVFEFLIHIYQQYGLYKEDLLSITKKGKEGAEAIKAMMNTFRKNPPQEINGSRVIKLLDYINSTEKNILSGEENSIPLPTSNVLQFILEDGTKLSARPSGTEPKIKFYFSVHAKLSKEEDYLKIEEKLENKINQLKEKLSSIIT